MDPNDGNCKEPSDRSTLSVVSAHLHAYAKSLKVQNNFATLSNITN